jgi:D-3-phosphoglycerate dehydrogenase
MSDSPTVVVPEYPMLDVERYRAVLSPLDARVVVAELGTAESLVDAVREHDAEAAVTDVGTPVPEAAFDRMPGLRVVARSAVGVANIDVAAARERGVEVVYAPDYCVSEVATHALSLLLSCVRAVPEYDRAVHAGDWPRRPPSRDLSRFEGTLGLLAFGRIARRVAEYAAGFDVDVVAHDPYVDDGEMAADGVEAVGFDGLLERSDYLSVHVPDTPETRGMLDAEALSRLDGAVLVNTGRGVAVEESALPGALDDGSLAAVGLDVLHEEPPAPESPLLGRDDVVLTPHAAWYSEDSIDDVNEQVASDVLRVLRGETPVGRANDLGYS